MWTPKGFAVRRRGMSHSVNKQWVSEGPGEMGPQHRVRVHAGQRCEQELQPEGI